MIQVLHVVGIQNGWAIENRGRALCDAMSDQCRGRVVTFKESYDAVKAHDWDIVHVHGLQILPLIRSWLRGYDRPWGFEVVSERSLKHLTDWPELPRAAAFCVAKNPRLCEAIAPYVDCEPTYIPNGVDVTLFKPRPIRVGWLGNNRDAAHEKYKGAPLIREAVAKANANFGDTISFEMVEPPAVYPETVPHAEIAEHLRGLDVFVCASIAEGCSNVVMEALACGVPVVSTDCGIARELLDDGANIRIVGLRDADAICRGILATVQWRIHNRRAIREYHWRGSRVTGHYMEIYQAVAAGVTA